MKLLVKGAAYGKNGQNFFLTIDLLRSKPFFLEEKNMGHELKYALSERLKIKSFLFKFD